MAGEDVLLSLCRRRAVTACSWVLQGSHLCLLLRPEFIQVWCLQLPARRGNGGLGGEKGWFPVSSTRFPETVIQKNVGVFTVTQNWEGPRGSLSLNAHLYYTVAHKVSLSPTHKKTQNSRQRPMIDLSPRTKDQEPETMVCARGRRKQ